MASYNAQEYIEFALDTIVAQKYSSLEVILIDGVSNDRTLAIVQEYKNRLALKIVSEKDNGVNDAFRKGFLLAEGDYICHLCATDGYMDINWISKSLKFLMSNNNYSAIFSSGAMEIDESGTPMYLWRPWIRELYRSLPYSQHKLVAYASGDIFPDMGWMVSRTVFLELFPEETDTSGYGEFNPFLGFIKALYCSTYHFVVLPQIASYGRQHKGQWGSQIQDETRLTRRDFKNFSRKFLWSLMFNIPQLCKIILSKFLRFFLFLAYGGIGYYLTKIFERYINDKR